MQLKTIHCCEELWENIQQLHQLLVLSAQLKKKKKTFVWKRHVCVVMSCIWFAYSCSEVRRLLGQVLGFSPLCLSCYS